MATTAAGTQRSQGLLAVGVVAAIVGVILFAITFTRGVGREDPSIVASAPPSDARAAEQAPPSAVWPIAAGLSLAIGAGLIGIGMNRWDAVGQRQS